MIFTCAEWFASPLSKSGHDPVVDQRTIPRGATPRTLAILVSSATDFAPNFFMIL